MRKLFVNRWISEAGVAGDNNFSMLRLFSALAVLFDHSFLLLDRSSQIYPVPRYTDASAVGVWSFFFISGFLVTRSWAVRQSVGNFLASRALRIFPGLWLTLLVTVFVIGPLMTTLAPSVFFSMPDTWAYLRHNFVLQVEMKLPGVFSGRDVNGPLWTLPIEIQMYILICLLGWLISLSQKVAMSAWRQCIYDVVLIFGVASLIGNPKQGMFLPAVMDVLTLPLLASFAAGAIAYLLRDRIPLRLDLCLLLIVYMATMPATGVSRIAFLCCWWYLLLMLAFYPFPMLLRYSKKLSGHDFSYGIYLSGFPIQQALIAYGTRDPWHLLGLSLVCSLAWAAASWHYVEKPCLGFKRYLRNP